MWRGARHIHTEVFLIGGVSLAIASQWNAVPIAQRSYVLSMCVASHGGPRVGGCVAIASHSFQTRIGAFRKTRYVLHAQGQLRMTKLHDLPTGLMIRRITNIPKKT